MMHCCEINHMMPGEHSTACLRAQLLRKDREIRRLSDALREYEALFGAQSKGGDCEVHEFDCVEAGFLTCGVCGLRCAVPEVRGTTGADESATTKGGADVHWFQESRLGHGGAGSCGKCEGGIVSENQEVKKETQGRGDAETQGKERPILFNGEMARAILDGRKTQTRRPVKPQPYFNRAGCLAWKTSGCIKNGDRSAEEVLASRSPFGAVGDLLWVRETWRQFSSHEECACYDDCLCSRYNGKFLYRASSPCDEVKWRPSIHMPRKACRITLRVIRVWVERCEDISFQDIVKEGTPTTRTTGCPYEGMIEDWENLWDACYGKTEFKYDNNPWVWACEFEVVR